VYGHEECIPLHRQQCRVQGVPLSSLVPECRTSVTGMKMNADDGTSPVPECSGTGRICQMPIPAASTLMPMPSHGNKTYLITLISEERLKQSCNLVKRS
jgi:hypothetical protein